MKNKSHSQKFFATKLEVNNNNNFKLKKFYLMGISLLEDNASDVINSAYFLGLICLTQYPFCMFI